MIADPERRRHDVPGGGDDRAVPGGPRRRARCSLAAFLIVSVLVARRPTPLMILTGVTVLAIAFFILPTRVHERYLFPLVALGAILAAVSVRWRIAYVVLSLTTFLNMYVVLTTLYTDNPGIRDWLGIGPTVRGTAGVTIVALGRARRVALGVRPAPAGGRSAPLETRARRRTHDGTHGELDDEAVRLAARPGRGGRLGDGAVGDRPAAARPGRRRAARRRASGSAVRAAGLAPRAAAMPDLDRAARRSASSARSAGSGRGSTSGPSGPIGRGRSTTSRRGRLDKLDLWILVVLVVSILGLRMFRLSEPYQMHFDEVYHARTATEFLQGWRYGIDHDIYEWTHPHLAKYAMAGGLVAWGDDRVTATSDSRRARSSTPSSSRADDDPAAPATGAATGSTS